MLKNNQIYFKNLAVIFKPNTLEHVYDGHFRDH